MPRCVMTVEWIIIPLSFRPSCPRHSRRLSPSLPPSSPFFEPPASPVYPVRKLAPSTRVLPPPPKDMQSGMGRVVVVGGREGSSMRGGGGGRGNDVTRMVEVGREIKAETFLFPYLFSDRCYQHARVFLHGGWLDGERERGRKKRGRKADATVKRG